MKSIVEFFAAKKVLFKELQKIQKENFGIKKRIDIYEGVDTKNFYILVVVLKRKSRVLVKDAMQLEEIVQTLSKERTFKKKFLLVGAPLCSKAKTYLESVGWKIYDFV